LNTAKALQCQAKYMFNHFGSKKYICSTIYIIMESNKKLPLKSTKD
jgi:hypothetical protein